LHLISLSITEVNSINLELAKPPILLVQGYNYEVFGSESQIIGMEELSSLDLYTALLQLVSQKKAFST
jgi:hypothetical protein